MSKFFFWLCAAPLLLFCVIFATSNASPVELTFWPLPFSITAPLYLFFLLILFISFFLGACAMWLGQHPWRAEAKRHRKTIKKLESDLAAARAASVTPPIVTATTAPLELK